MAMNTNDYTEGRVRQHMSPNTQRIDFGLRAIKTYDNAECREDSWEVTDDDAEGCNQEGTSAHRGQTMI